MRVFKDRLYLIVLIIIIMITAGIWYSFIAVQPGEQTSDETAEQEEEKGQQARLQEAEFTVYNSDKTIRWELSTSELLHKEKDNLMKMTPVNAGAYTVGNNRKIYSLEGTAGNYSGDDGYFEIEGPVNVKKGEYVLEAGKLVWNQERDVIKGSGGLKLSSPEIILTGNSFETDTAFTTFTVYGNSQQAKLIWRETEDEKNPQ